MKCDFSGYATKSNIKCSDGRTILPDAFKSQSGETVPLVWQHMHDNPDNVLGHAVLEHRADGVYAYCSFNKSTAGEQAKELVRHGDIKALSIFANKLVQRGTDVLHGAIREVSLVLTGANPGAYIENITLQHGDTLETLDSEAIIYSGEEFEMAPQNPRTPNNQLQHADSEKTVQDVFDEFTEEQKNVVYFLIGQALESADEDMAQSDYDEGSYFYDDEMNDDLAHAYQEGLVVSRNVFDGDDRNSGSLTLSHDALASIVTSAKRGSGSFKEAFLEHAGTYGIDNIDILFPDAKLIGNSPDFIARRMEWVNKVLGEANHSPFSRIKTAQADITADEARAKGYIKGNLKKEEVFRLLKRVTGPTTVYKKQKLDRDDMLDITDLDVVAWLKAEMRIMLDEELARAILIGDGRPSDDDDKIREDCIRPIWTDDNLYAHHVTVDASMKTTDLIEEVLRSRSEYRGSGAPTLYVGTGVLSEMLVLKDTTGRRIYENESNLASSMRVSNIVEVPVFDGQKRNGDAGAVELVGILVNLKDYTIGADRGGSVSMFDDFDIDYNQHKYLIETRCSGALTKPKSAIVFERKVSTVA